MHRHAAVRLNLTSATELSNLNTAGQAWVHGRVGGAGYHDNFKQWHRNKGSWRMGDFSSLVQNIGGLSTLPSEIPLPNNIMPQHSITGILNYYIWVS